MKKVRTVLCFVLIAMLMLGALPLTAHADGTYVESVGIYCLDEPVAGRNPDYLFSTEVEREFNGYTVQSVEWLDVAAGTPMQPDDTFVEGQEYALCVTLTAADDLIFCFDKEDENCTAFRLNYEEIDAEPGADASTAIIQQVYTCVEGDPIQYISEVTIDLPALYAGEEFPFDEEDICNTEGVSVKCETRGFNGDPNYPYMFNGIVYLTYDTSKVKTPEDFVEADTLYRIQLSLETWPGYEFATDDQGNADIAVTVNGGELIDWFSTGDYGRQAIVRARITSQDAPEYTIEKADVFSIDEPVAGRTPDYEFAFEVKEDKIIRFRRNYDINDEYSRYGVMWHDNTDKADLKPTDTFIEGHSYSVTVVIKGEKHYYFNFDESDPNANTWFYINHKFAEEYYAYDDTNESAVLKKTFTCVAGDPIKIISEIYITTPDPVAGEKGAFTAESLTEGVSIDVTVTELMYEGARDVTFVNGVSYAPVGGGACITEDDTFDPNTLYTVGIAIHTDDGYELLSEQGTEVWEPEVYINGEPIYFAYAQPGDDYLRSAILHRQVTTGDDEASWNLDITMDEPALGGTPDRDIEVESDGYDVSVSHVGYVFDGLEGDEANVPDDYVFRAGDKIWVAIYVSIFDDEGEPLALSPDLMPAVTVNGEDIEANYVSNAVTVIRMYEIAEPEDVDKVDVYNLDAPIAGRNPDYNFSRYKEEDAEFCNYYLSDENDSEYTKNAIRWHDDTDGADLKTTDTFIEGHQYTVIINVSTGGDYAFNFDEDGTEFLINHEPADSVEELETVVGVAVMKKTFTCVAGAPVKIIDSIVITTPELVGGSLAPFTAEVETEGVIVEPVTINYVGGEMPYWFDGISYIHDGTPIDMEHVVVAGDIYYFGVLLEAEEGYEFALDEDMDPTVKVTINGVETELCSTAGYDTSHHGGANIDMTADEEDVSIITNAIYVTLTEPKAGENPDFTATAEGSVELTGNHEVLWTEVTAEGEFTALLEDDSKFEKGKYYMATVTISAAPGFAFDAESLPKVFFNGNEADAVLNDGAPIILATYIYKLPLNGGKSYILGDVNNDGQVKNRDALILDRYIAGWKDYDKRIINWKAADLSRDGQVKNRDALMLDRFIAGWKSYQKYIFEVIEED